MSAGGVRKQLLLTCPSCQLYKVIICHRCVYSLFPLFPSGPKNIAAYTKHWFGYSLVFQIGKWKSAFFFYCSLHLVSLCLLCSPLIDTLVLTRRAPNCALYDCLKPSSNGSSIETKYCRSNDIAFMKQQCSRLCQHKIKNVDKFRTNSMNAEKVFL